MYAAHEKVYCYVGMVQMIGLPFAGTLTTVCVVYVVPLGLLVLIGVLNREG